MDDAIEQPLTLENLKEELTPLYQKVNEAIKNGENTSIIIKKNKKGEQVWRLKPLKSTSEPTEGLFLHLQQHSSVDIRLLSKLMI